MQQANEMEKLVQELEENVNEVNSYIEKTVKVLREGAEILDNYCKTGQIFSAIGRFSAVICDCLGIAGNLDVITDDYAGRLAMVSTTFGMTGEVFGASLVSESSNVVARAAACSSHYKGSVRAAEFVGPNVRAINIQKFKLTFGACGDASVAGEYLTVAEIRQNTASFLDACGRDVTQESGACVGAEISVPFGAKFVRSIIDVGSLVWDCTTLYNTLNDIKNNKGSDVSKSLRKRACAFEALLPANQE